MPSPRKALTNRELKFIARCRDGGHTTQQIAEMTGRTPDSLRGLISYHKIGGGRNLRAYLQGPKRAQALQFLSDMIQEGHTLKSMARHLNARFSTNYSPRSVHHLIQKLEPAVQAQHRANARAAETRRKNRHRASAPAQPAKAQDFQRTADPRSLY